MYVDLRVKRRTDKAAFIHMLQDREVGPVMITILFMEQRRNQVTPQIMLQHYTKNTYFFLANHLLDEQYSPQQLQERYHRL